MLRSVTPCSPRRNTGAKDRGRPLGLATVTGPRAGRARPSQPPLSRASGERRSVPQRRSRGQAQRARKFARAFWWGACTASTTPPGLSPQSTKTADDAWQIPVHVASKNRAHLERNSHLEGIAKHSVMSVAKSAVVGKARPSGIAQHRARKVAKSLAAGEARPCGFPKHSAVAVAKSVGIGEDRSPRIANHRAMTASVGVGEVRPPGIAKHSAVAVAKPVGVTNVDAKTLRREQWNLCGAAMSDDDVCPATLSDPASVFW